MQIFGGGNLGGAAQVGGILGRKTLFGTELRGFLLCAAASPFFMKMSVRSIGFIGTSVFCERPFDEIVSSGTLPVSLPCLRSYGFCGLLRTKSGLLSGQARFPRPFQSSAPAASARPHLPFPPRFGKNGTPRRNPAPRLPPWPERRPDSSRRPDASR